ncbi:MAG TPA: helix-turn-helix domain-containing protein [Kofleriaceae bacterium]|nr:helix-turn-helix domain-containing protein [Kofleriaceae bacterium]
METNGIANNARQRLGEVIRHYREDRDITKREVSRRCKVPEGLVDRWEGGEAVPNSDEWKALCRGMNRALNAYQELYLRARKEADDDARSRAVQTMSNEKPKEPTKMQTPTPNNPSARISTSLGDKLAAATAPKPAISIVRDPDPEPAPPSDTTSRTTRAAMAKLPKGWKSHEMLAKRRAFALDILRQRPNIRDSGADSLEELLQRAFGVGLANYTVKELREQAKREADGRPMPVASPPPMQWHPPIVQPQAPVTHAEAVEAQRKATAAIASPEDIARMHGAKPAPVSTTPTSAGDIETAVQLVLEALPNLQTFTIHVDEHGEASVDYQIRKVVITTDGGSFKVKR